MDLLYTLYHIVRSIPRILVSSMLHFLQAPHYPVSAMADRIVTPTNVPM